MRCESLPAVGPLTPYLFYSLSLLFVLTKGGHVDDNPDHRTIEAW
ncbi:MAG: hypothetical protein ABI134_32040 [Byssovorax sp.]